jgi:hypothetical protein
MSTARTVSVSDQLERWLRGDAPKTLGSLVEAFGEGSFAIVFVLLMALPALPLPTGGATHVFELITMLLAIELISGRRRLWLPERFKRLELARSSSQKVIGVLLRRIRWLERFSRPRGQRLLKRRLGGVVFGAVVFVLALTAFLAPPFSGLDTLPSIGVVMVALGYLLTDVLLAAAGIVVGAIGVVVVIVLGSVVVGGVSSVV